MTARSLALLSLIPVLLCGCEDLLDSDTDADSTPDADGLWSVYAHPCVENQTDALWIDDASTAFVGCGTGVDGRGMFRTTDGGATWSTPAATGNVFDSMRVNSISRASDGLLYVAGTAPNGVRVVTLDGEEASIFYAAPESRPQVWQTFQVGTFRMDDTGRAVAESLTGSDVIYWSSDASEGESGEGWWNTAGISGGAQILDLEVWDGRFFGSGSTINQPPYFYYEAASGMGESFALEPIQLSGDGLEAFTGEAWDVDIDGAGNAIVAGVNQDTNTGVLWFSTGDLTVTSSWTQYDISPLLSGDPAPTTRFYGACRDGDTLVAVGDYSTRDEALVVLSIDGGATWALATPPGTDAGPVGSLSRCTLLDGTLFVAGAGGFFGTLDTAAL